MKEEKFENFIRYFAGLPVQFIRLNTLNTALDNMQEPNGPFFAIESLIGKLRAQMQQFTATIFPSPKGILFYGPPGTGKSAISKKLCELLGVTFAAPPMAAGDFNKGIVGDSERMLNEIADRANLVPWEMCVLLIDEIDTLAPNRMDPASNQSGKGGDLLGVFLAILDGSKQTPNLKILASTNLREKMDEAFLRRMEIQLFMGNPSADARQKWVKKKSLACRGEPNYDVIESFISARNEYLKQMTLNYSADALRKVLERFYQQVISEVFSTQIDARVFQILNEVLRFTSEEMRVYLGKDTVIDIMSPLYRQDGADQGPLDELNAKILDIHSILECGFRLRDEDTYLNPKDVSIKHQLTRRFLIDLAAPLNETLQIETILELQGADSKKSSSVIISDSINQVIISDSNKRSDKMNQYKLLLDQYPLVQHRDSNKAVEYQYNKYRNTLLKNKIPQDVAFQPKQCIENFIHSIEQHYLSGVTASVQSFEIGKNLQECKSVWLQLVILLSQRLGAETIKLIDSNFFFTNKVSEDQHATQLIINTVEEMKKYDKAVLILDLDSISGVYKQHGDLKEDLRAATLAAVEKAGNNCTFKFEKTRPQAFNTALKYAKDLKISDHMWIFCVSSQRKITQEAKEQLDFPLSQSEQDFEKDEIELAETKRCINCFEFYTDKTNAEEKKCGQHIGQLYNEVIFKNIQKHENMKEDEAHPRPTERVYMTDEQIFLKHSQHLKLSRDEVFEQVFGPDNKVQSQYKWTCCNKGLFEKGEIVTEHRELPLRVTQHLEEIIHGCE